MAHDRGQVAVLLAAKSTASFRTDPVSSLADAYGARHPGPFQISNFFEVFGDTVPSGVSNSQLHYGTTLPVYIEDQPLLRGGVVGDALAATIGSYLDVKLLVDDFTNNDFGDTHSIVLIADSLALMNLFVQLDSTVTLQALGIVFQGATATKAITSVTGGQGKAEGDTLETVLDALNKLFTGNDSILRKNQSLNEGKHLVEYRTAQHVL